MNDDRERLEDLNMAEAAGHDAPPDLTAKILAAAERGQLEDAVTPISGIHSVPKSVRPPQGRRMTASVRPAKKRNWQGAGFVVVASLLITVSLVAFILTKQPSPADPGEPETAEQTDRSSDPERTNEQAVPRGNQPETENQPDPVPDSEPKPDVTPDEPVEEPKPEEDKPDEPERPVPDDVVEIPEPDDEPEPEPVKPDVVEDEPKKDDPVKDDGTVVKPKEELVAVASTKGAEARETFVRATMDDDWKDAVGGGPVWVYDGWQLKSRGGAATLTNGAFMTLDGEVSMHTHTSGLRVELTDDDLYLDNFATTSPVWITHDELEVEVGEGVVVVELSSSRFEILCVDGEVTAAGELIPAGHKATLSKRGLSSIKAFTKRDWSNPMIGGTSLRQLGIEEFDVEPAGGMINGRVESRTNDELEDYDDGYVAVDQGSNASVAFMFDGEHKTLRGEFLHVRYRATGAEKLILQMFCPARDDNFGIDLTPEKDGEWHVVEIPLKTLRDRISHSIAPEPGTVLSSFTLTLKGINDAQLEVDWVELVRAPDFGE